MQHELRRRDKMKRDETHPQAAWTLRSPVSRLSGKKRYAGRHIFPKVARAYAAFLSRQRRIKFPAIRHVNFNIAARQAGMPSRPERIITAKHVSKSQLAGSSGRFSPCRVARAVSLIYKL